MTRSIPPSLAPVLEHLELERPKLVSVAEIATLAEQFGIRTPGKIVAHRLAERGWLLPTEVRGIWEFAPADRAGPISDGDSMLTLLAIVAGGDPQARVALGSAMWLLDLADRAPDQHEVAVPVGASVPAALQRAYRVVRYTARLKPVWIKKVPVHRPETVLVHLACRPSDVRSWSSALSCLPDLVGAAREEEIREELADRPHATHVRLAYLLDGVAPDLVKRLDIKPAGKVWFGPRGELQHHSSAWNIADTVLPFEPSELKAAPES